MLATFQKELLLSSLMFVFLVCSILGKIMLGVLYQNMIKETENMRATKNKRLKQCKLKFVNCYRLNHGVANVPVFVDKYLNQMKIGPVSVNTFYHLCGQTMLLSVLCGSITKSAGLFAVLPYYIVSFLGLYLHFAVSAVMDIRGRRRVLKINLVDFLENHMSMQLAEAELTEEAEEAQDIRTIQKTEGRVKPKTTAVAREEEPEPQEAFSSMNEKELEELLKEFLTL